MANTISDIHYSDGFGSISAAGRPIVVRSGTDKVGKLAISRMGLRL